MRDPRRPPPPFDVAVVTGFLGAGKTTLLNRLLRDPALADALVLINEFGSVGLDHLLIEKIDGDMLLMSSGCLCCLIRGDLVATLENVLRQRDNGRMAPFKRMIIETTGLADPIPVLQSIMAHPYLRLRFRVRAVVTVVDALVGAGTLDRHKEAITQVAVADHIVLSKADLLDENGRDDASLRLRLRALNPMARISDVSHLDAGVLFSGKPPDLDRPDAVPSSTAAGGDIRSSPGAHHHHDHHYQDVNRHDASIRAFSLRDPDPASAHGVTLFMTLLSSAHGAHLLRFKGLIALTDDPARPLVAHGVQHVMHEPERLAAWPDDDHETRMVFIGRALDQDLVEGLWRASKGELRPDTADLGARLDNPLAPARGGLLA